MNHQYRGYLAAGLGGLVLLVLVAGAIGQEGTSTEPSPRVNTFLEDPIIGDRVRVLLVSGGDLEGELVAQENGEVVIRVGRIEMRFREGEVRRLVRLKSSFERFHEMREAVNVRDEQALMTLATWARDERLLDESLEVVGLVLEINPGNRQALALNRDVAFLLKLRQEAGEQAPEDRTDERRAELAALRITEFPYLTDEQINIIKVYEVDLKDPPRIQVSDATRRSLMQEHADHPLIPDTPKAQRAFLDLPDAEVLDLMFRVRARDLYSEVRVGGGLEQMRLFRDRVNAGWLTRSCGTTDCHGGLSGGSFLISNRWRRTEKGVYTNFYILSQTETSDGLPMIDASEPRFSAMLQMGLPRETALWPHPEVVGWRPAFRSEEDRWFTRTVEWIETLYRPRPEYDLDYVVPADRPRDELRGVKSSGPAAPTGAPAR